MKTFPTSSQSSRKGFTLVELLVALAVTAIIISMLVTITATALDGYATSRNQVKAAREAKAAFDQMARDLESLVVRSGNDFQWLWISTERNPPGPNGNPSPNASRAVFFTAATDRYDGDLNSSQDRGGDVSTVGYRLLYRDPVSDTDNEDFASFILYRQLINPDETFENLLGQEDLEQAYRAYETAESDPENFVCENIYEFSLSFVIEYTENNVTRTERVLVVNSGGSDTVDDFRLSGNGILADNDSDAPYANGRIVAADLSLTVINNSALETLRNGSMPQGAKQQLLEKNSHYFSKTILLPQP
ncbi:prepilin-type N-terminal cleavage/methylation domain-containing protein [Roseibacillus ishigakijimensis]|uniref:Prepilin-type N-terminal cleavage/methylation domain-containing protein n=1 Tax=Roseibacillus ishigakijimensis TaxID=454146 RepID=A0A934VLU4_9BACT|nr:prepilin-type N-terminal cleavage/methylation domain-containing protein [Roseibacillus ishigakijimensis]MBK1833255.1 prepilin-type N-terminal cleavage/methylation domain-containing protein [Roseibacillus ishigakijimensis]